MPVGVTCVMLYCQCLQIFVSQAPKLIFNFRIPLSTGSLFILKLLLECDSEITDVILGLFIRWVLLDISVKLGPSFLD